MFGKRNSLAVVSIWICFFMLGESAFTSATARHCYHKEWGSTRGECGYIIPLTAKSDADDLGIRWMNEDEGTCQKYGAWDVSDASRKGYRPASNIEGNSGCHVTPTTGPSINWKGTKE